MKSPEADGTVETTLEEDLAAAMVSAKANEATAEAAPAEAAPAPAQTEETAGRERDDTGRFKPKPGDGEAEATPEAIIPDRYGVPPNYAKQAVKENWANLPPEVRKELHDREREVHQQFTRTDDERNFGRKVKEVVAPYEGFIRQMGADPVQAVDYLIKTDYALRTAAPEQRRQMFLKAAADYGIQFGEQDMQGQPQLDPRLETMQQRINRLESERQGDIQARQLADQQSIEQQIADFSSKPENVYFDRVSPTMAALLSSGQAASLEQAYDMAVHADPKTRALQLAAHQAVQHSQRSEQLDAQAQQAKRAAVSVTGAPGLSVPASSPNATGSLEDDIRNAIQAASSRI